MIAIRVGELKTEDALRRWKFDPGR